MVSSLHKKWSTIVRLFPLSSINALDLHLPIKFVTCEIEKCGLFVQVICSDNYPQNVNMLRSFPLIKRLFLLFDAVHILKCIRNNWLNTQDYNHTFLFPSINNISTDAIKYPLTQYKACFEDVRLLYKQEHHSFAKIAHHLTAKSCWPSSMERQNVKLALKIFNKSTIAGLQIQNDSRDDVFKTQQPNLYQSF